MLKNFMSRRAAIGAIAGASIVGPAAIHRAAELSSINKIARTSSGLVSAAPSVGSGPPNEPLWRKELRKLYNQLGGQIELRRRVRVGGLDPDLFALNSIPIQNRMRMQLERDQVFEAKRREYSLAIWPEGDGL